MENEPDSFEINDDKYNELGDFLAALDHYSPTVPEEAARYYLEKSGATVKDDRIARLVALAADRFLADALTDADRFYRLRGGDAADASGRPGPLTVEDLRESLKEYGVRLPKATSDEHHEEGSDGEGGDGDGNS
mmetsp:Transcript_3228/g.4544  ORF Transcript_3228/g.4544 Transcript_3228/m.4544 type:complete len:134 (-) Transcript_3228:387-788(-)